MQFNFLICSERSGSNLISKIIDAHPEVCAPFPSHMIRQIGLNLYRYGDLNTDKNWEIFLKDVVFYLKNKFAEWQTEITISMLKENIKERNFGAIVRYVYETEAKASGKTRVFVKENHTFSLAPFILSHFPDSKFIWLVRDPRDMALTWKELAWGGVIAGANTWQQDQQESIELYGCLKSIDKILLVKFEDLLTKTEKVVRNVCDFLQITYNEQMLAFHKKGLTAKNSNKIVSWQDLQKPIQKDNFNLYKKQLCETEIRYIETLCKEEMDFLGYVKDFEENSKLEELEKKVKNINCTDRTYTDEEKAAYNKFFEGINRITSRKLY